MGLIAVIGGSGFSDLHGLRPTGEPQQVETPFGATSAPLTRGTLGAAEILFLPRHGAAHQHPPHRVNYRANLWALRACGAQRVIGLAAVGGITAHCAPHSLLVPDQIIDYTYGRDHTFSDGGGQAVAHVDMTEPYCASLRADLLRAAAAARIPTFDGGTYGATQGPRLETAAEIARLSHDGCDIVGMTGMPEASLARELELCYAALAFVVNWAAGKGDGPITLESIESNLARCKDRVEAVLTALAPEE